MPTMSLIFATVMLVTTAWLTPHPAQALGSGWGGSSAKSFQTTQCARKRVCSSRACVWRTICH